MDCLVGQREATENFNKENIKDAMLSLKKSHFRHARLVFSPVDLAPLRAWY